MRIGVPKEIKPQENRIGLTPDSVKVLVSNGHEVLVENNAGFEAGFEDNQYKKAGAKIVAITERSKKPSIRNYKIFYNLLSNSIKLFFSHCLLGLIIILFPFT